MHAVREARGLHQSLYIRDLSRDRRSRRADGDQTEIRRTFRRRLDALGSHVWGSGLLERGKGGTNTVSTVKQASGEGVDDLTLGTAKKNRNLDPAHS
jgi:hypothetical protein